MWYGRISEQASLITMRSRAGTPPCSSCASSVNSASGDSTTPLPIRQDTFSRSTPEGIRCNTVFCPSITSVWPALCPPWKRTTALAWSVSKSTILPLPSSPHWVPMTTTVFAMKLLNLLDDPLRPGEDELTVTLLIRGRAFALTQVNHDTLSLRAQLGDPVT